MANDAASKRPVISLSKSTRCESLFAVAPTGMARPKIVYKTMAFWSNFRGILLKRRVILMLILVLVTAFASLASLSSYEQFENDFLMLKIDWKQTLQDTNYAIVLDCGSSGSRAYIYKWRPGSTRSVVEFQKPKSSKIQPGLSSLENNPVEVESYLSPLLEFAKENIPVIQHSRTPFFLFATAGMRLISTHARKGIMMKACLFVQNNSNFNIQHCEINFRVISGELEGILGWLSINYLKSQFDRDFIERSRKDTLDPSLQETFGFIDIGGASAQIAFEPTAKLAKIHRDDLTSLKIRHMDGIEKQYDIFVATFLGFGANQARERYTSAIASFENLLKDPCLPNGLYIEEYIPDKIPDHPAVVQGYGNFAQCFDSVTPILNKQKSCKEDPCLFNGVHAPIMDFRKHKFVGVSNVWYTTFDVFGLGGNYSYPAVYAAAKQFCETDWNEIMINFQQGIYQNVDSVSELKGHCFKSAYLLNVLHVGLKFPMEEWNTPLLESIDKINGFDISWTLGAVLLYASSTVIQDTSEVGTFGSLEFMLIFTIIGSFALIWLRKRFKHPVVRELSHFHAVPQSMAL